MTEKQLLATLDGFATKGLSADLWLRDDDATMPTEALDRLLALSRTHTIPMTLAVIPEPSGNALASRLRDEAAIDVAVHGWAHRNHAGANEKKRELGLHRPKPIVVEELKAGLAKLQHLHENRFVPMLVPPWNRIDREIVDSLPSLGFSSLSVYGPEEMSPIPLLNTHVDVIDWRGTRGGKSHDLLFAETAARMSAALSSGRTTGILTHHLDHDETVWHFLERLFSLTSSHPGCRWRSSRELIASSSP